MYKRETSADNSLTERVSEIICRRKITMGNNNGCGCVKGVACDVKNCKYNDTGDSRCTASNIKVQNKSAMNKSKTFCDTFCAKGSDYATY